MVPKQIMDFVKAAEEGNEIIWDKCMQAEVHFLKSIMVPLRG